jgi:hypothetical protein
MRIDSGPGFLWLRRGDAAINPFELVHQMQAADFTEEKWHDMVGKSGADPEAPLLI